MSEFNIPNTPTATSQAEPDGGLTLDQIPTSSTNDPSTGIETDSNATLVANSSTPTMMPITPSATRHFPTVTPTATRVSTITFISPHDTEFIMGEEVNVVWEGELPDEDQWFTVEIRAQAAPKEGYLPHSVPARMYQFSGPIRQNKWTFNREGIWVCEDRLLGGHTADACNNVTLRPGGMEVCVLWWSTSVYESYEATREAGGYRGSAFISSQCIAIDWYN